MLTALMMSPVKYLTTGGLTRAVLTTVIILALTVSQTESTVLRQTVRKTWRRMNPRSTNLSAMGMVSQLTESPSLSQRRWVVHTSCLHKMVIWLFWVKALVYSCQCWMFLHSFLSALQTGQIVDSTTYILASLICVELCVKYGTLYLPGRYQRGQYQSCTDSRY